MLLWRQHRHSSWYYMKGGDETNEDSFLLLIVQHFELFVKGFPLKKAELHLIACNTVPILSYTRHIVEEKSIIIWFIKSFSHFTHIFVTS